MERSVREGKRVVVEGVSRGKKAKNEERGVLTLDKPLSLFLSLV